MHMPALNLGRVAIAAAGALGVAAVLTDAWGQAQAAAADGGRPIAVEMTGAAEAPGPGDPDGRGQASFRINPGQTEVCYELTASAIGAATAAHIHRAPAGQAGPVVVPLAAPSSGSSRGCVTVSRDLAKELIQTPGAFYVNVHNAEFPAGAIRGQLAK